MKEKTLQFIGERGRSFQGDIGLDDVSLDNCFESKLVLFTLHFTKYNSWKGDNTSPL